MKQAPNSTRKQTEGALRKHGEKEAERIVRRSLKFLGLASTPQALAKLPKSEHRKVALASLLRERSSVSNGLIAARLVMGHPGSVSRMLGACKSNTEIASIKKALAKEFDQAGKKGKL